MLPRSSLQVLTLLFRFLTSIFILLGQLCGNGKYVPSDCSSGTLNENLPSTGSIWQIDIDTTNEKVLWWQPGAASNKARQATISDFSNMYHIVMVFGGGFFDLSLNNGFLKTKYNPVHVTYPTSTRVQVLNGATTRIIGEKITTTSVTSYRITFTSYGTNMCFGLISIPDINTVTLDDGDFQAHWGVCVGSTWPTDQLTTVCQCKDCAANCATCTGASSGECTACKSLYYYSGTSCAACHSYCSVCTGSGNSQCTACKSGYFLQPAPSTTCLTTCPNGYWKDTTNNICAPCDIACSNCTGPNSNQCSSCSPEYFQHPSSSTTCLSSCPNGYYGTSSKTCSVCHPYCSVCTGSSYYYCSACKAGYYLQPAPSTACLDTCPSGTWKDTTNQVCAPCDTACSACTGPNNNQCTSCKTGYFRQPSSTICLTTCPNGYYGASSNTCTGCHANCLVCTGPASYECSACKSVYFFSAPSSCVITCPSGAWKDTTNQVCEPCNVACSACTGSSNTQCSACKSGYFLQPSSTICLDSCPNGYYGATGNICSSCNAYCSVCTGPASYECSACKSGYFLQPAPSVTTCSTSCPSGYWKDATNNICATCNAACATCSDGTPTQCTVCNTGYFLQPSSTTCLDSCPDGYWEDPPSKSCGACHSYCSICTGNLISQCSVCKSGYFLQPAPSATTCTNTCPSGYWKDTINNFCAECDPACFSCTGPSNTQCSACSPGYFLQPSSTTCLDSCPTTGYWQDTTNHICAPCNVACTVCLDGTNTQCTECKPGYSLQSLTTCYSDCPPDNGWDASILDCVPCDVSCSACTGTSYTQCLACKPGYFLQPASSETTCTNTCPSGYWKDITNNICAECNVACTVCSDGTHTQCTSCQLGYFQQPSSSICLNSCPDGYWEDSTNHICATCDPACSVCSAQTHTQCTACKPGYFLQPSSTSCLNTCPTPGYWEDTTNHVCAECNVACAACTDASNTQCSVCNSGYFLQPAPSSTTCLNTCPTEYWQDTTTRKCMPCDNACSDCLDGTHTQCSSCKLGYFLQPSSTTCLDSCPTIGYWQDTTNHLCASCNNWCSECTGSLNTQCSACSPGYFLQPSSTTCLDTCPDGYWGDSLSHTCVLCHTSCEVCSDGTHTQCAFCKPGYFLQPSSTTCLNYCPHGSWKDTTNHICSSCDISCSVCTGANNDECSSCNSGYFLQPAPSTSTCLNSCPTGYWGDATSRTCMECDISCSVCSDGTNTQCSSCKTGYFLQVGSTTCLTSCASGTWPSSTSNICLNCDISCATCSGPGNTQCSACKTGYFLQPSSTVCLSTCPPIYYYPDSSLHACKSISYFLLVFLLTLYLGCPANCLNCTGPTCNKLDKETLETIEGAAKVASAAVQASTIATIILPVVATAAGSVVALFLDFLGEIAIFQYINVPFPANFEAFMQFFGGNIFPNLFENAYDESESVTSTIGKFEEYECSQVFLDNCGGGLDKEFLAIAVIIVTSILALGFKRWPKAHSMICKVRDSYRWNGFLAFYIGDFQEFFVFTLLQFRESVKPLISLIIGILLVISYLVWYLYLSIALNRRKKAAKKIRGSRRSTTRSSRSRTSEEKEEEIGDIPESMNMVVDEFVRKNWYSRNFLLLMCLQNAIFGFILVFLQNWGTIQAGLYSYIEIFYGILVLGAFRPFKEKSQAVTFTISQIVKGIMGCLALALGLDEKWMLFSDDQRDAVGIALITLASVGIAGNGLLSVGMIGMKIIDYCRKFKRKKREETKTQNSNINKITLSRSDKKSTSAKPQNNLINNHDGLGDYVRPNSRTSTPPTRILKRRPKPNYPNVSVPLHQQQRVRSGNSEQMEFDFQAIIRPPHARKRRHVIAALSKKD